MSSDTRQPRRTLGEISAIVATIVVTTTAAIALLFGPVLIALWWVGRAGITAFSLAWAAIAVAWIVLLVIAAVRNAETRGWIAVGLFGWVGLLVSLARRRRERNDELRLP